MPVSLQSLYLQFPVQGPVLRSDPVVHPSYPIASNCSFNNAFALRIRVFTVLNGICKHTVISCMVIPRKNSGKPASGTSPEVPPQLPELPRFPPDLTSAARAFFRPHTRRTNRPVPCILQDCSPEECGFARRIFSFCFSTAKQQQTTHSFCYFSLFIL